MGWMDGMGRGSMAPHPQHHIPIKLRIYAHTCGGRRRRNHHRDVTVKKGEALNEDGWPRALRLTWATRPHRSRIIQFCLENILFLRVNEATEAFDAVPCNQTNTSMRPPPPPSTTTKRGLMSIVVVRFSRPRFHIWCVRDARPNRKRWAIIHRVMPFRRYRMRNKSLGCEWMARRSEEDVKENNMKTV